MRGALDSIDFFIVFPMKGEGNLRLIGTIPKGKERDRELRWEDVSQDILTRMKVQVNKINWFSTYRVHHGVAASFRQGRGFLLGDAGHIHSPVGGQGMNTGIDDAINLAWKIRDVLNGRVILCWILMNPNASLSHTNWSAAPTGPLPLLPHKALWPTLSG